MYKVLRIFHKIFTLCLHIFKAENADQFSTNSSNPSVECVVSWDAVKNIKHKINRLLIYGTTELFSCGQSCEIMPVSVVK